ARASDGHALGQYFAAEQVDVLKITPTHLAALLAMHPSPSVLPRRCVVLGGEGVLPSWVAELQRLSPGCRIVNEYGPTETTVGAVTYCVDGNPEQLTSASVPIGRPLGNVRAYVLNAAGEPAP